MESDRWLRRRRPSQSHCTESESGSGRGRLEAKINDDDEDAMLFFSLHAPASQSVGLANCWPPNKWPGEQSEIVSAAASSLLKL